MLYEKGYKYYGSDVFIDVHCVRSVLWCGAGLTYDSFSFVEKVTVEGETTETKMPHDALGINIAGTYWFTDTLGVEANLDFARVM